MRNNNQRGIVIGPILAVVAILAVLASAIAAGSGIFSASISSDRERIIATIIIEQATEIANAVNIVSANGCEDNQINFSYSYYGGQNNSNAPTDGSCAVFNISGGRLSSAPIPPKELGLHYWRYRTGPGANGIGTSAPDIWLRLEYIDVSICRSVNRAMGHAEELSPWGGMMNAYDFDGNLSYSGSSQAPPVTQAVIFCAPHDASRVNWSIYLILRAR